MMLKKNMYTLKRLFPQLAKRISWPVQSDHIIEKENRIGYVLHETAFPIEISTRKLRRFRRLAPQKERILLWGCALGELLDILLEKSNEVVVWERDPWLLRRLLKRRDFAPFLESGQLRIILGADIILERGKLSEYRLLAHPFFGSLYHFEKSILENPQAPIAMLCCGDLFVKDVGSLLRTRGYAIYQWDVERLSHDEILYGAITAKPKICMSINYRYGLAEIAERISSTLLIWEIDPAMDAVRPVVGTTAHSHLFTWRSAHVSAFQEAGFQNVSELPLATNPNRCFPKELSVAEKKRFGGAVSFVGASLVRQGMHYRDIFLESYAQWSGNEDGAEKLEKLMCAQRINWNQFAIPELLSLFFPRFSDAMKNAQVSLSSLLGESVASEKRMHYVRSLCVHQIAIWGDRDWGVLPGYRGYAGHLKEVVQIYRGSSINVDINRIYQSDIVTMRVFDVIASGSFVLTEYTPALEPLFEVGTEIETYRTLSELHEKIEYYQSHPEKRTEIIEAGRARILKEHTMQHRMNSIFTAISQR